MSEPVINIGISIVRINIIRSNVTIDIERDHRNTDILAHGNGFSRKSTSGSIAIAARQNDSKSQPLVGKSISMGAYGRFLDRVTIDVGILHTGTQISIVTAVGFVETFPSRERVEPGEGFWEMSAGVLEVIDFKVFHPRRIGKVIERNGISGVTMSWTPFEIGFGTFVDVLITTPATPATPTTPAPATPITTLSARTKHERSKENDEGDTSEDPKDYQVSDKDISYQRGEGLNASFKT